MLFYILIFLHLWSNPFETSIKHYKLAKDTCENSNKIHSLKASVSFLYKVGYILNIDNKANSELLANCYYRLAKLYLQKHQLTQFKHYLYLALNNGFKKYKELQCYVDTVVYSKDKKLAYSIYAYLLDKGFSYSKCTRHLKITLDNKTRLKGILPLDIASYRLVKEANTRYKFNLSIDKYLRKFKNGKHRKEVKKILLKGLKKYLSKNYSVNSFNLYHYLSEKEFLSLIMFLWKQNHLVKVEKLLKKLQNLYPEKTRYTHLLASVYEDLWNLRKAIKYHNLYLSYGIRGKYYLRTLFKLGLLNYLIGNKKKAKEYFKTIINSGFSKERSASIFWARQLGMSYSNISDNPLSFYALIEHIRYKDRDLFSRLVNSRQKVIEKDNFLNFLELYILSTFEELKTNRFKKGEFNLVSDFISKISFKKDLSYSALNRISKLYEKYALYHKTIEYRYYAYTSRNNSFSSMDMLLSFFKQYYSDDILKYAKKHKLSPAIVFAIARRESAFKLSAESRVGALGLMQLMPFMLSEISYNLLEGKEIQDIDINLDAFGIYFNKLLKKYKGSYIKVIAAYNAGPEAVDRWLKWYAKHLRPIEFIEFIPYQETRRYVKAVLFNAFMYGSLYGYDTYNILREVLKNDRF